MTRAARSLGRLAAALRAHWLAILLGWATGLYVAFAAALGLMLVSVAHGDTWSDATLALVLDAILLVAMATGGLAGYQRRRNG